MSNNLTAIKFGDLFDLNVYIDRIDGHYIDCNIDVDREELPNGIKSHAESFMRYDFVDNTKAHAYFDNDEIVHLSDDLDKGELYTIDAFGIKRFFDIASSKNENYQSLLKKMADKGFKYYKFFISYFRVCIFNCSILDSIISFYRWNYNFIYICLSLRKFKIYISN